jgi:hypothetical protein
MMALLLASTPEAAASAESSSPAEAPSRPAVSPTPTSADVLFASGFKALQFHALGAWSTQDGTRIAFFAPGPPGLDERASTLVVKDTKTDATVWRKVIFSGDESERLSRRDLERLARTRLVAAGAQLPGKSWLPMDGGALPEPDFASDQCYIDKAQPSRTTDASGLKITYQEPRLRVEREGAVLLDLRRPAWRARNESCNAFNPTWLQRVYVDRSRRSLLVGLGHCGVDACPEPAPAFHAVALPGKAPSPPKETRTGTEQDRPRVGWESEDSVARSLYAQGVPAVSGDAASVLLGWVEEDGTRRDPNLQLELRGVDDNKPVWTAALLRPGEVFSTRRNREKVELLESQVRERVTAAETELAARSWRALKPLSPAPAVGAVCVAPPRQSLSFRELTATLERGRLTVRRAKTPAPVLQTELSSLLVGASPKCLSKPGLFLEMAYIDPESKVLVLRLGSCESSECPAPAQPRFHALRLP